jgi:hypothetical protein
VLDGPGLPESWQGPRDRRQRGGGRLFRAEGTCRTPSPLPASLGVVFSRSRIGVVERSDPCREAEAASLASWLSFSPCPKARDTQWIGSWQKLPGRVGARKRRLATGDKRSRRVGATKDNLLQGSSSPRPRRPRLLSVPRSGTQGRALRNRESCLGSSRRTGFNMGWTPR